MAFSLFNAFTLQESKDEVPWGRLDKKIYVNERKDLIDPNEWQGFWSPNRDGLEGTLHEGMVIYVCSTWEYWGLKDPENYRDIASWQRIAYDPEKLKKGDTSEKSDIEKLDDLLNA